MAYNTKNIIRDASGAPIPQFYNPVTDAYQPLTGVDLGGGRYGYDGLVWGKTAGGLYVPVKVADDGTILTQLTGSNLQNDLINAIPIKYPYFEKRYTQYDNYSLAAGASLSFHIWDDVVGYKTANLIIKKEGSNSFVIELYNEPSGEGAWYKITQKTTTAVHDFVADHPIAPQTGIYIRNDGTTAETIIYIKITAVA